MMLIEEQEKTTTIAETEKELSHIICLSQNNRVSILKIEQIAGYQPFYDLLKTISIDSKKEARMDSKQDFIL